MKSSSRVGISLIRSRRTHSLLSYAQHTGYPVSSAALQYFLTGRQQQHLDHERRLTADHMRRLNQVLAGHLSCREVSKLHAERESREACSAAPSHGSGVGFSTALDDSKDAKGGASRRSPGQSIFRRLVRHTRESLAKSKQCDLHYLQIGSK